MPRKPTGRPVGRPTKAFRSYPGWIVRVIETFLMGDLTTQRLPAQSLRDVHSALALFNRARVKFVEDARAEGRTDEADVALDIIARPDCDLDGTWQLEFSARGWAMDALQRVQAERAAKAPKTIIAAPEEGSGVDLDERLEAWLRNKDKPIEHTPEEEAAIRAELDAIHARDRAATAALLKARRDRQAEAEIDAALENEPLKPQE